MANIPISSLPEITSIADSVFLAVDDGVTSNKITVQNFNATASASAQHYADLAATSATNAATSASEAAADKSAVTTAITNATALVSDAQTYANAASGSASTASTAASTATNQAGVATTQAQLAATYAQNVSTYSDLAKSYAVGGTGTRSGEDTDNAEYYANAAHTSEINAASSESNAATSEANAATSESNASAAATSAQTNALKAEGYAVGSQNGTPAVSGETYYHDNAKYYKEEAADSATNAASSEYNAGLSETAAATAQSAAEGSKEDSEAWAVGERNGIPVPASDPTYHNNAKYWADMASGGGTGGVTSFNGRAGNVVPLANDYAASLITYDNTTSGLTATDTQAAIDEVLGGLGTAAALNVPASGNASTTEVVKGDDTRLTDARTPVSHTHTTSDITNFPTLGTAAALNVPVSGNASTTEVVKGDDSRLTDARTPTSHSHSWTDITSKPFSTIGSGLTVTSDTLNADVQSVSVGTTGTASSSAVSYQRIGVNGNYTEINGTKYMEQELPLNTSQATPFTFTNNAITTNSVIEPYSSIWGLVPSSVSISNHTCTVEIPKQETAQNCKVRIYIK